MSANETPPPPLSKSQFVEANHYRSSTRTENYKGNAYVIKSMQFKLLFCFDQF